MPQRRMPSGQGPGSRASGGRGSGRSDRAGASGRPSARLNPRGVNGGARTGGSGQATGRPASRTAPARRATAAGAAKRTAAPQPRRLSGRAAVLGLVVVTLLLSYAYPVRVYLAQQAEIAHLESAQTAQKQRIVALSQQREKLNDPQYIRTEARRRFQMVLPGEIAYVIVNDEAAGGTATAVGSATAPGSVAGRATGPWYEQLWTSIRSADKPRKP